MKKSKQLLNDTKETRGYWKLKQEALDHTLWRICFGRGYGPVIRETTECVPDWIWSPPLSYQICIRG